jgi:hypothetical protein
MAALRANPWTLRLLLVFLAVAFVTSIGLRFGAGSADAYKGYQVPHDAKIESATGVRFEQAAVVGDGGLIELTYTVLDTQKASRFQSDVKHPPVIYNEKDRRKAVYRTALMRQGHDLRPGQTYFILYQNNGGTVKRGGTIEINAGGGKLVSVPVR